MKNKELIKKNISLYNLEREERNKYAQLIIKGPRHYNVSREVIHSIIAMWSKLRLAELKIPGKQVEFTGYWPNMLRSWKEPALIASDEKHICDSWAYNTQEKDYFCAVCGLQYDENTTSTKEVCDWELDDYYIAFSDYLNRTKKELQNLLAGLEGENIL